MFECGISIQCSVKGYVENIANRGKGCSKINFLTKKSLLDFLKILFHVKHMSQLVRFWYLSQKPSINPLAMYLVGLARGLNFDLNHHVHPIFVYAFYIQAATALWSLCICASAPELLFLDNGISTKSHVLAHIEIIQDREQI